ncbi:hypothetical protein OAO18_03255 [Francisellaceae bacterium]|nr:hypothetical protein [Francisellaceae bacterium]
MQDSEHNANTINHAISLLKQELISQIDILSYDNNDFIRYAGSSTKEDLLQYYKLKIWQTDIYENLNAHYYLKSYDYSDSKRYHQYAVMHSNKVFLYIDRHYLTHKDIFIFGMNKKLYLSLSLTDRVSLCSQLNNIITFLYKELRFTIRYVAPSSEVKAHFLDYGRRTSNVNEVLNEFNLTIKKLNILNYIGLGMQAKDIANMSSHTHRTIEDYIRILKKRYSLKSKSQLEDFAKIILNKLKYKCIVTDFSV